jgi:hypothetical protein
MEVGSLWRLNGGDEGSSYSNKTKLHLILHQLSFFRLEMNFLLVILGLHVSFPRPISRIEQTMYNMFQLATAQ